MRKELPLTSEDELLDGRLLRFRFLQNDFFFPLSTQTPPPRTQVRHRGAWPMGSPYRHFLLRKTSLVSLTWLGCWHFVKLLK